MFCKYDKFIETRYNILYNYSYENKDEGCK